MHIRKTLTALLIGSAIILPTANGAIIADGDFSSSSAWPDGWLYEGGSAARTDSGGGNFVGEVTGDGSSLHGLLDVVEAGGNWGTDDWTLTFSARNTDGATNVEVGLLGPGFADWETFTLTTTWQTFTATANFAPLANNNGDVFFYQRGTGSIHVDNVSIIPEPTSVGLIALAGSGIVAFRRRYRLK